MDITITKIFNGWLISSNETERFATTDPIDGLRRILDAYDKRASWVDPLVIEYPKLKSE